MKLCEECFCRAANIHLMQITGSAQQSVFLCEECARKHGISISLDTGASEKSAPEFEESSPNSGDDRECSGCGMKFSDYAETGRVGCSSCYASFGPEITALQRRFDDAAEYRGKRCRKDVQRQARREKAARDHRNDRLLLQQELDCAIKSEQFERAAFLRDAINHLDEAGKG